MLNVYTKTCAKNIAGNNAVLVTEASNISSVTVDSNGEVTGITMVGSATFKELQADQDSIVRLEEATGNDSNIAYTHSVQMGFAKGSVNLNTLRDSLAAASPCGIVAIVQDSNGKSWLVGYNEVDKVKRALRLTQDSYASGNSPADEDVQKADIVLESVSGYPDLPFDSDLNDSITDALAAGGGTAIEWDPESYGPELHTDANAASDPNGNEADTITGWSETGLNGTGANVFESQASVVNTGSYAFHLESNDTPTVSAGIDKSFTVESGEKYEITFAWRHVGAGIGWRFSTNDGSGAISQDTIVNTETSFVEETFEIIPTSTSLDLLFATAGGTNDGGIYLDNLSIRKKLT